MIMNRMVRQAMPRAAGLNIVNVWHGKVDPARERVTTSYLIGCGRMKSRQMASVMMNR